MYCRQCGKQIDYDSEFCNECKNDRMIFGIPEKKNGTAVEALTEPEKAAEGKKKHFPFVVSILSVVSGLSGWYLRQFSMLNIIFNFHYGPGTEIPSEGRFVSMPAAYHNIFKDSRCLRPSLFVASVVVSILAFILGLSSILVFASKKRKPHIAKPIPTLILGIVGAFLGLSTLYKCLMFIFV